MSSARPTKKKSPSKSAGAKKRDSLTEGIAKLFYEMGYEKTSTRDIAKTIGVPNSALYYYFQSKQEMLFAIIDGLMENVVLNLKENIEPIQDPEKRLLLIIQDHINSFVSHKYESKALIYDDHCLEGDFRKIVQEKERRYFALVRDTIGEIIRNFNVRIDANVAAFSLFGMLNWIYKWYDPNGKVAPNDLSRQIFRIILTGVKGAEQDKLKK
jgi:TetR/AcrR family transcriptional regulator, cholesterol catabolism regulator